MYEMKEGILIRNTVTGEVGTAQEYSYTTFFAYRYMKEPNCVYVETNGERKLWLLRDCEPTQVEPQRGQTNQPSPS